MRSQMAEAFARNEAPEDVEVFSAGFEAGDINPRTVKVMSEIGYDISNFKSKKINEVNINSIDIIITLCESAKEKCPVIQGKPCIVSWDIPEPSFNEDNEQEITDSFRSIRDTIQRLTKDFFTHGYFKSFVSMKANLDAVLGNFIDGVIVHDNNRIILNFNRAAERITGWSAADVISRDCREIFPNGFCGDKCSFCEMNQKKLLHLVYPIDLTTKDGTKKNITMSVMPVYDRTGEQSGVIATFHDVTRVIDLEMKLADGSPFPGIISTYKEMQSIFSLIRDIKGSDAPVLIQGETGTGKEMIAHAIHKESRRADRQFVPVNCGALPEGTIESELFGHVKGAFTGAVRDKKGRFELADGGTIFLDEVAELSQTMQVKLLRVLQDGTFERLGGERSLKANFRLISATNKDLKQMIKTGAFREDLFYRICVVPITMPPLRERSGDILVLADYFLKKRSGWDSGHVPTMLSAETKQILQGYRWPGNIRQLQNAIQYAKLKCKSDTVEPRHLPQEITESVTIAAHKPGPGRKRLLDSESVAAAMKEAGGSKAKAARILGVNRATLYRFIDSQH